MALQNNFGIAVQQLRKERSMSQEQLALSADIDRRYMSDIENGKRNVSLDIIERLAATLRVSASELLRKAELLVVVDNVPSSKTKQDYINWMRREGLSPATIKKYAEDTPNNLEVQNVLSRLAGTANMYSCTKLHIESAIASVSNMEFDNIGHKMYSAGLKKYLKFLSI